MAAYSRDSTGCAGCWGRTPWAGGTAGRVHSEVRPSGAAALRARPQCARCASVPLQRMRATRAHLLLASDETSVSYPVTQQIRLSLRGESRSPVVAGTRRLAKSRAGGVRCATLLWSGNAGRGVKGCAWMRRGRRRVQLQGLRDPRDSPVSPRRLRHAGKPLASHWQASRTASWRHTGGLAGRLVGRSLQRAQDAARCSPTRRAHRAGSPALEELVCKTTPAAPAPSTSAGGRGRRRILRKTALRRPAAAGSRAARCSRSRTAHRDGPLAAMPPSLP